MGRVKAAHEPCYLDVGHEEGSEADVDLWWWDPGGPRFAPAASCLRGHIDHIGGDDPDGYPGRMWGRVDHARREVSFCAYPGISERTQAAAVRRLEKGLPGYRVIRF